ncbi:uncharacterized protein LOC116770986 isoform X1 [Danaus plexippus]|uniref:uncharacterized protein LOC116770986 isoform X1 n=1 Tax=Danaus plexippus TaxID=13037 RepID=UPI002AB27A57|nr:uncharacterized protein LOC116770986 isoform X1 [Danaus plexippus]XP_061377198.1 uncharacterized protein LOC116770986 isoform X1 [Danaus plexippus]
MSTEEGEPVDLYIYDLTKGLASLLSPTILGRQVEGVWHTAVVVFGREYFYGGGGVTSCAPGSTQLGAPYQVERLGTTYVPFPVFQEYIQGLATSSYTGQEYRLLEHNCNHFSDEVAQFVCGARVPKHIVSQAERDLPPPLRVALQAALDHLVPDGAPVYGGVRHSRRDSPDYLTLNDQIEEARVASQELDARRSTLAEKLARKERRKEKKRRKQMGGDQSGEEGGGVELGPEDTERGGEMSEAVEVLEARPGPSTPPREDDRPRPKDPPILFKDIDGVAEYEALVKALEGVDLNEEERRSLDELQQYLVAGEGSWVLGDDFLAFVGRVLSDSCLASAARVSMLRCLCCAALREDVSLVLHQDRRHHALLSYAYNIDRLPVDEQLALLLFMVNLFSGPSSSEWLLYISEWSAGGPPLSNIRVTTKVCVHGVLAPEPALRDAGTALLYNVATKERLSVCAALRRPLPAAAKSKVFDEVCVELCMAALQLCSSAPAEELLWRALASLARLAEHSHDVPQLVALVGPDPSAFRGTSPRVDEQVDLITQRVAARG